jgi:hypothetical protein
MQPTPRGRPPRSIVVRSIVAARPLAAPPRAVTASALRNHVDARFEQYAQDHRDE